MVSDEVRFIFNTFSFLVWGGLVMWMAAGFTMLESGSVRTKNAAVICLKNIGLYSVAGIAFYLIGYNLMYVDVGSWIGSVRFLYGPSADEIALLDGQAEAQAAVVANGYSVMSDWFFQMVFVATAASIVSGALAERVKLWSFFAFTLVLTAVIYPIVGAWTWGGGWLNQLEFKDFAGSTIVHGTGGWAALAGLLVVGPRRGKYRSDGTARPTPPSSIPTVTLGVFILWFGWFGFNGGSQLALGSVADVVAMSNVLVNTNLAGAAGFIAALALSRPILGRLDLMGGLNGVIGGLVAITAGPDIVNPPGRSSSAPSAASSASPPCGCSRPCRWTTWWARCPPTCLRACGARSPRASPPAATSACSCSEWPPSGRSRSGCPGWCGWRWRRPSGSACRIGSSSSARTSWSSAWRRTRSSC